MSAGEHGQAGDIEARGAKGDRGEKGASGVTPWVVRRANLAYALMAGGLLLAIAVSQNQQRADRERDAAVMVRFESEAIATDTAFCGLANQSRGEINRNRDAIRAMEDAVRSAFELVVPAPDATAAQRQRTLDFRAKILGTLDSVKVEGNLALLDCSGIGNGRLDFSRQDAVTKATSSTTTTRP